MVNQNSELLSKLESFLFLQSGTWDCLPAVRKGCMAVFPRVSPTRPSDTQQLLLLSPSRLDSGVVEIKGKEHPFHMAGAPTPRVGARGAWHVRKAHPFVGGTYRSLWEPPTPLSIVFPFFLKSVLIYMTSCIVILLNTDETSGWPNFIFLQTCRLLVIHSYGSLHPSRESLMDKVLSRKR